MTSSYQPETCQFLKLGPMLQFKTSMVTVAFKKWNSTGTVDEGYPTTNTKLKWMDLDVYVSIIQDS